MTQPFQWLTPLEFAHWRQSSQQHCLIDVRTLQEHRAESVSGAHLHPIQTMLPDDVIQHLDNAQTPVLLLCQSGKRAIMAAERLAAHIDNPIHVIQGGVNACKTEVPAVIQQGHGVSMERQVRIAAGSLLLVFSVLGWWITPQFYFGCLLIGAGLLYAGLTDHCGMARVLARCPWNRTA